MRKKIEKQVNEAKIKQKELEDKQLLEKTKEISNKVN